MKTMKYSDSQVLSILKQAENGVPVTNLCREHGMSSATFYKWRGKPLKIRCDNGPEYISHTMKCWAFKHQIELDFIEPGKPQQNAYVERYNRTVRYDWLSQYLFDSLDEVRNFSTEWLWTYNNERPNMALNGITPKQKLAMSA